MSSQMVVLITLVFYKLVLLGIGFWASKRVVSESDFFIAGKGSSKGNGGGLGPWVAGLSYAASTSSAWVLLGYTGFVFSSGFKALWLIPGIFGGYALTWLVMGPRLNAETAERGHITIVDFLTGDVSQKWRAPISALAAVLIIFCFVFYVAAQFQAAGNAFSSTFGLGLAESVILGAVIIVAYCLMGGFWAASITDTLQALVMVGACLLVPIVTITAAGGMGSIMETLHANEAPAYFKMTGGAVGLAAVGGALGLLGTGLGAAGQPQLLNRIMAVKDRKARLLGAAITIGWGTLIYIGVTCLALAARALLPETPSEQIFFATAEAYLPPILAGIVLAAILSAVMSTVDSLLLAAASAVSHDLGAARFMPDKIVAKIGSGKELLAGRLAMIVIATLSVILTLTMPDNIFDRVLFSWVALGAAFGPTVLARCIGWNAPGLYVFLAIFSGFIIAVIASGMSGTAADLSEKWLSWIVGFAILFVGKMREFKKVNG